jgi:hypothetical protein
MGKNRRGFQKNAVIFHITARIMDKDGDEIWTEEYVKITIPGKPVRLKLLGGNIAVIVQFTPLFRHDGQNVLIAHGQVWLEDEKQCVHYETTIQTIPLKFGEDIYYFPLGNRTDSNKDNFIEICIKASPYSESKKEKQHKENTEERHD